MTTLRTLIPLLLVFLISARSGGRVRRPRDERGLTQSTENAVLLAGALAIATIVVTLVSAYVESHLPK